MSNEIELLKSRIVELELKLNPPISFEEFCKKQNFILYDFQRMMVDLFNTRSKIIISHARNMGVSTILRLYAFWYAQIKPNTTIIELYNNHRQVSESMNCYKSYGKVNSSINHISFDNGSKIILTKINENNYCGVSADLVIIDNAAYISHHYSRIVLFSILPMITNGKLIIASVPDIDCGMFYDVITNAPRNDFFPFLIPWWFNPDNTYEAICEHKNRLSEDEFRQQYECKFLIK